MKIYNAFPSTHALPNARRSESSSPTSLNLRDKSIKLVRYIENNPSEAFLPYLLGVQERLSPWISISPLFHHLGIGSTIFESFDD